MKSNVTEILKNAEILHGQNANWRSYGQDIADFCLPRKAWQTTLRQKGDRLNFNFLYDSVAIRSLKTMVAGFHSNMTNPASQWFGFEAQDRLLQKDREVQLYFKELEEIVYPTLANSNFYNVTKEFYGEAGAFGTGVIMSEADDKTKVRFRCLPFGEYDIEEDAAGRVNGFYWHFKLTAKQAFALWGKNAGKTVLEMKDTPKAHDQMDFLLYVGPRSERDSSKIDQANMPFKSCWIAKKDQHLIEEGGFEEFPFHVGRWWKDPNDTFGYSPAMDVIADVKLMNAMKKTALRRAMKETDPPLDVPSKGYIMPLNLNPAALNIRDAKLAADNGVRAFGVGHGDFNITREMMEGVKEAIEEGFFVNLFRALSLVTKQMTVPEVQERIREGMILLGPAVGNFTEEVFDPCLMRVLYILSRKKLLPEPPAVLQGADMGVVHLSPLVKAQRESEMQSIGSFVNEVIGLAAAKPAALDKLNEDQIVDIIAKIRGINPQLIRSDREIVEIRKARDEAQMASMQLDAMHKGAAIAKTDAEAQKAAQVAA